MFDVLREDGGVAAIVLSAVFYRIAGGTPENRGQAFFIEAEIPSFQAFSGYNIADTRYNLSLSIGVTIGRIAFF